MAVFNENFEKKISESGELRKDFLNNTSLGELIDSTTRKDAAKVKSVLTELEISNLTLGQINTDKKITQEFVNVLKNRTLADGSDAFVKPLIQSFGEVFKEAGYIPPKGTNPVRNLIKEVLGESQAKELFDVSITRKNPLAYKTLDPYKALKKVATNLVKSDPNAGYHLLTMIQGGYRPSDFKSLRIENIDFETGEVVGLEIKDELARAKKENRAPKLKAGYFPQDVLDILKQAIGGRTEGLVFENIPVNSKTINNALKKENIQVKYSVEGVKKEGTLTIEDVRKMHESNLDAQGVERGSVMRNALTLRGDKTVVGGYVATAGNIIKMEKAHLKAFSVQAIANGNSTIAQYLADVGVPEEGISSRTKKYKVTKKVFENIPPYLQERIINENPDLQGVELADKSVSTTEFTIDPTQAEKYQELSSKKLETQIMDETIIQAGKQDKFFAAQKKLTEGKELRKAETIKQKLETAKGEAKKGLDEAGKHFNNIFGGPRTLKNIASLVGAGTATKLTAGVLSGGTAALPLAAEAAAELAFSSTPTGEKTIDPKTGLEYTQPERPPSNFMTEDEILSSSRMAKGQFEPDVFQQAGLDRKAQKDKIQSFLTTN